MSVTAVRPVVVDAKQVAAVAYHGHQLVGLYLHLLGGCCMTADDPQPL